MIHLQRSYVLLVGLACAWLGTAPADAQTPAAGSADPSGAAAAPAGQDPQGALITQLALRFGASENDIRDLVERGADWSEIGFGLAVADRARRPLMDIMAQRDGGRSWRELAQVHGVRMDIVTSDVQGLAPLVRSAGVDAGAFPTVNPPAPNALGLQRQNTIGTPDHSSVIGTEPVPGTPNPAAGVPAPDPSGLGATGTGAGPVGTRTGAAGVGPGGTFPTGTSPAGTGTTPLGNTGIPGTTGNTGTATGTGPGGLPANTGTDLGTGLGNSGTPGLPGQAGTGGAGTGAASESAPGGAAGSR
jgi:hypothetical protein